MEINSLQGWTVTPPLSGNLLTLVPRVSSVVVVYPHRNLVMSFRPWLVNLIELLLNLEERPPDGESKPDGVIPPVHVLLLIWCDAKVFTHLVVDVDKGGRFFLTFDS